MHKPIFHDELTSSTPLPLTTENLMNLDKNNLMTDEILQRYILLDKLQDSNRPSYRERCQSTPPQIQQKDLVVASPRLLPFPYHNDSLFLPTAETIQYNHLHYASATTTSCSTSRADSTSLLPDSEFFISRPHSTANISSSTTQSFLHLNDYKPQLLERRSLPIKLDYSNIVISKTGSKQQRFLRRSSSFGSSSTLSVPTNEKKKPWLKRILKIFNKNKHKKQQQKSDKEESENNTIVDQVWYCQYNKNPTTNFKRYHHQYQHQRSMIFAS